MFCFRRNNRNFENHSSWIIISVIMTANRIFIVAIEISSIVFTNTKKPSYSYRMSLLNRHQVALIILPLWAVGGGDLHARKILFIAAGIVACLQVYERVCSLHRWLSHDYYLFVTSLAYSYQLLYISKKGDIFIESLNNASEIAL